MLIKSELDHRIATSLGIPVRRVASITDEFVEELCNAIIENGGFHLIGLGKLKVRFEKGSTNVAPEGAREPMRIRLYFSKSRALKEQIERKYGIFKEPGMNKQSDGMTKYAVNESVDGDKLEKAASKGCPICAAPVVKHGRVLACPTHGTEPFE